MKSSSIPVVAERLAIGTSGTSSVAALTIVFCITELFASSDSVTASLGSAVRRSACVPTARGPTVKDTSVAAPSARAPRAVVATTAPPIWSSTSKPLPDVKSPLFVTVAVTSTVSTVVGFEGVAVSGPTTRSGCWGTPVAVKSTAGRPVVTAVRPLAPIAGPRVQVVCAAPSLPVVAWVGTTVPPPAVTVKVTRRPPATPFPNSSASKTTTGSERALPVPPTCWSPADLISAATGPATAVAVMLATAEAPATATVTP